MPSPERRVLDRVLASIEKPEEGCWLFLGSLDRDGYGTVGVPGLGTRRVHRIAHAVLIGPIPEGMEIDHLCRVRNCINPSHLEAVTRRVNSLRSESFAAINARKTHCAKGHPYSRENTYLRKGGGRTCRICNDAAKAKWRARKKAERAAGRRATPRSEP